MEKEFDSSMCVVEEKKFDVFELWFVKISLACVMFEFCGNLW